MDERNKGLDWHTRECNGETLRLRAGSRSLSAEKDPALRPGLEYLGLLWQSGYLAHDYHFRCQVAPESLETHIPLPRFSPTTMTLPVSETELVTQEPVSAVPWLPYDGATE